MKNVLTSLAKSVLLPLGLTAVASATHAAIQKTILWIDNEYIDNLRKMKIAKSFENLVYW